jgi:DNA-binding NarL/FixJ family response regulator
VAEDHGMMCQGLVRLFQDDGRFTALGSATHGHDVLDRVRDLRPNVAVLSFSLHGMDGIGLTSRILEENLPTHCVVLSVRGERYAPQRSFLAGARGCVFKEGPFEGLADIVQRVAAGGSRLRSGAQGHTSLAKGTDPGLSKRELEVLRMVGRGLTSKQIAECLFISSRTVDTHRMKIMRKLGIPNGTGLVKYAFEHDLDSW